MCSTGTGKQEKMQKISKKKTQHQQRVATISFARQMMAGDVSSWEGKGELDSGVREYGRWKTMSKQCRRWEAIRGGVKKSKASKG